MKRYYIILLLCFVGKVSFSQTDGQLDSTFGNNGVCVSNFINGYSGITSMGIDPQHNIIITSNKSAIKIIENGVMDTTFAVQGIYTFDFGDEINNCSSLLVQPDGKIILGGYSGNPGNITPIFGGTFKVAVVRLHSNGMIDSTFGTNGKYVFNPYPDQCNIMTMAIQTDGKIIAAGAYANVVNSNIISVPIFVTRINSNGTLDSSFANNGIFKAYADSFYWSDQVNSCAIAANGKIILGFTTTQSTASNQVFGLMRLTENGLLDQSFGQNGIVKTDIQNVNNDILKVVKVHQNGKILSAGSTKNSKMMVICRYNVDGSLDTTFALLGIDTLDISFGNDGINDICVLDDGKYLAVGQSNGKGCLIRINPFGKIDSTFHQNGILLHGNSSGEVFINAALTSPNQLVAGGILKDSNNLPQLGVAAYDFNLFSGIEDAGGMQEAASIYPNPSRNSIQFKQAPVSFNMSVCDLTGKLLAQKQMQASESYDVSTLQEGLYFIKLQTTEATQVIKFLKQ
jgi:uncharacterized delta-60 repeat protein